MLCGCGEERSGEQAGAAKEAARSSSGTSRPDSAEKISTKKARQIQDEQERIARAVQTAPAMTRTYKHPLGPFFLYPDGWTLRTSQNGLMLLPPKPLKIAGELAEVYLLFGDDADGVSRADDPRIAVQGNQLMDKLMPFLKRDGQQTVLELAGRKLSMIAWRGKHPKGPVLRARLYVLLLGRYAIGVLAICAQETFEARDAIVRDIVRSIGFEKPKNDPRLPGKWRYSKTYISGSFSAITVRYLFLNRDGTCLSGGKLSASMQHSDAAGNYSGDSAASGKGGIDGRGTWRTQGKTLSLDWGDGNVDSWQYYSQGRDLLLKQGKKTRQLWRKVR